MVQFPIIVVANGAVEHVVLQNAIERLALGYIHLVAFGLDPHLGGDLRSAGANQLSIHLDHAGVAGLDRPHLLHVTGLRNGFFVLGCLNDD